MAMSREAMQAQAAERSFNRGKWVERAGGVAQVTGAGVVTYETLSYFGALDAIGRFIHDVGLPFLTKISSFLIPGFIGLLVFATGTVISNIGRRTQADATASLPAAA